MTTIQEAFVTMRPDFSRFGEEALSLVRGELAGLQGDVAVQADTSDAVAGIDSVGDALGDAQQAGDAAGASITTQLGDVARHARSTGLALTAGLTAPITAIKALSIGAFLGLEEGLAIVRQDTGATGVALRGLQDDFRAVAQTVSQDFAVTATVAADVNTRLGVTGPLLQSVSRDILDLARVSRTSAPDLSAQVGQAVNALELSVAEIPHLLDLVLAASQQTGIGIQELLGFAIEAGPAFERMGFGLERQIALFATFERAGARPQELLSSMNILLTRMAREGVRDAEEGFRELLTRIREAPDDMQATIIAADAFGDRVGARVAEDIRAGRFEIDEMVESLVAASGTLRATADESLTFRQEMSILGREAAAAVAPLGQAMVGALRDLMPLFRTGVTMLEQVTTFFAGLPRPVQLTALAVGALAAATGPLLISVGLLLPSLAAAAPALGGFATAAGVTTGAVQTLTASLIGPGGLLLALGAIAAVVVFQGWNKAQQRELERTTEAARALRTELEVLREIEADFKTAGLDAARETLAGTSDEFERIAEAADKSSAAQAFAEGAYRRTARAAEEQINVLRENGFSWQEIARVVAELDDHLQRRLLQSFPQLDRAIQQNRREWIGLDPWVQRAIANKRDAADATDDLGGAVTDLTADLMNLNPRMIATAAAARIIRQMMLDGADGTFQFMNAINVAIAEAAAAIRQVQGLQDLTGLILREAGETGEQAAGGLRRTGGAARGAAGGVRDLAHEALRAAQAIANLDARGRAMAAATELWHRGVRTVEGALEAIHPAAVQMIRDLAEQEDGIRAIADALVGMRDELRDTTREATSGGLLDVLFGRRIALGLDAGLLSRDTATPGDTRVMTIEHFEVNVPAGAPIERVADEVHSGVRQAFSEL